MKENLYIVDDNYIEYLREFDNRVMFNKNNKRKYLGIILKVNNLNYFVPLSSPKKNDYNKNGNIKASTDYILRIIYNNELKGNLKFNNMIPVPNQCLTKYNVKHESNVGYQILVSMELSFIRRNFKKIMKKAYILYREKNINNKAKFKYLKHTVNFKLLEEKCQDYFKMKKWRN
jgi:protein AbiQ